jgi:hypothetical protein
MHRTPIALIAGLGLCLAVPATAFERGGIRSGFPSAKGSRHAKWHSPHKWHSPGKWHSPHRRPLLPVGLDRSDPLVTVVIQQVFVEPPPPTAAFQLPTVLDLPVQLGIREAKPAEPAVYVLNEGEGRRIQTSSLRLTAGPKIVDAADNREQPEPGFGAKIIHLTVPVGGSR